MFALVTRGCYNANMSNAQGKTMVDYNQLEHCYWNVRQTLEIAQTSLTSPHPLWSELNELMETCMWLERVLDIANPWESTVGHHD